MRPRLHRSYLPTILCFLIVISSTAIAQDVLDRDAWSASEGDWTNDDNWVDSAGFPSIAPTLDDDRWAFIGNGGTAILDSATDTAGLEINNGVLDIRQGGSLTVDVVDGGFSVGQGVIGNRGVLRLSGNGTLKGLDVTNRGSIEMLSSESSLETKGDFSHRGTLRLNVSGAGTSSVKVGGDATLGGSIVPNFDGVTPSFGDSFPFLTGADSVTLNNPAIQLPESISVGRGLNYRIEADNSSASLVVGNLPILQVHRATGAAKILNVVGGPVTMTGYEISSALGLLDPAGFTGTGADGWDKPNPIQTKISEISLTGQTNVEVDQEINLGNAYNGGATHPADEDVGFRFSRPDGTILHGLVEYLGPANDLVLNANPETGEVTIQNLSPFIDPIEVTGYNLLSGSGSLLSDNWTSFAASGAAGDGWTPTTPSGESVAELNLTGSHAFGNGTVLSLGNIFNTEGPRDLVLQYTTADSLLNATVEYQSEPPPCCALEADFNGDGIVNFSDFLILSTQFNQTVDPPGSPPDINGDGTVNFPDFLVLSTQFNTGGGAATAVPEPTGLSLFGLGGMLLLATRRRRQENAVRKNLFVLLLLPALAMFCGQANAQICALDDCPIDELRVFTGEVVNITGPADIVSLRQPNNILYAVNVWGEELERVVNGVSFWSDREDVNPDREGLDGYRTDWTHNVTNWQNKPEFGDSADDDELEEIMTDIRWTNNDPAAHPDPGVGSHFAVSSGERLYLELLISGGHDENRIWDIYVEGEPVVSEFDSTNYRDYNVGEVYAYRGEFIAQDDEFNVTFNQERRAGIDGNAILQAVILSKAGDPVTLGDFNADGAIDLADYGIMLANFHKEGAAFEEGDMNFDRTVDLGDFVEFRAVFDAPAGAQAVPEPSGLVTLGIGGLLLGLCRRRRQQHPMRKKLSFLFFLPALAVMCSQALGQVCALDDCPIDELRVFTGEVVNITGPADLVSLRQPNNILYAVNVWGEQLERVVNGVSFWSDREDVNPDGEGLEGYRTDWTHNVTNWQNKPEFGDTADDDELEEIMTDIRWTDNSPGAHPDPGVGSHFAVNTGDRLYLELLVSGGHDENRIWDIYIDGEPVVSEFDSTNYRDYDVGEVYAYRGEFIAKDDEFNVTFNQERRAGIDGNAILQAAILSIAGEPLTIGDFNSDGTIDTGDFQLLVDNFRKQGAAFEDGDINFDRIIDLEDFLEFRIIFNAQQGPAAAAIPEPSSLTLFGIATVGLLFRRRRRC